MKSESITHESFGIVQLATMHGRFDNLFQSGVDTQHAMSLTISRAAIYSLGDGCDDGSDHVIAEEQIVQVTLSPLQFAELLTSGGSGDGVPCTLESVAGRAQLDPPRAEQKATRAASQFVEDCHELSAFAKESGALVAEILAKGNRMKVADRDKLRDIFRKLAGVATDTGPYLMGKAEGHLRRLVSEAKATISSHAHAVAAHAGTEVDQTTISLSIPPVIDETAPPPHPVLPPLPPLEIRSKAVDDMSARDLGILINHHLRKQETAIRRRKRLFWEEHRVHEDAIPGEFYMANAHGEKGRITVVYVSYQGSTNLTLPEARAYLRALRDGWKGPHWRAPGVKGAA